MILKILLLLQQMLAFCRCDGFQNDFMEHGGIKRVKFGNVKSLSWERKKSVKKVKERRGGKWILVKAKEGTSKTAQYFHDNILKRNSEFKIRKYRRLHKNI